MQLSRTHRSSSGGYCGAFTYIDDWELTGRVRGVIVQKITRALAVQIYDGGLWLTFTLEQARQAFDPHDTTLFLNTMTYWELFDVPARGDIHGDQFQSNWFARTRDGQPVATTKGTYTIKGEARFYATNASHADLGFGGNSLPVAAGLPSTTTDPSQHLTGLTSSNEVTRTVTATWDSHRITNPPNAYGVTQIAVS
jgi:hypothetical protein